MTLIEICISRSALVLGLAVILSKPDGNAYRLMELTESTAEVPKWHSQIFQGASAVDSRRGFDSMCRSLFEVSVEIR